MDYDSIDDESMGHGSPHDPMAALMGNLFKARDTAHMWHWKVKSFAHHMALGDLYEQLLDLSDSLMEMYMGRYGTDSHVELSGPNPFSEQDPIEFVRQLCKMLDTFEKIIPQDGFLVNKYQEIQGLCSQTLYKMENLH